MTIAYSTPDLKERTPFYVNRSLPLDADLKAFFAGHDLKQLEATTNGLVAAIERRAKKGENIASAGVKAPRTTSPFQHGKLEAIRAPAQIGADRHNHAVIPVAGSLGVAPRQESGGQAVRRSGGQAVVHRRAPDAQRADD